MPPERRSPTRRGRPARDRSLTPRAVAEAAAALIAEQGVEGFSMRRLGERLGVEAMALYNHFPDRESLLSEVASQVLARVVLPPSGGSWRTRMKRLCGSVRELSRSHPNLFRLALMRPVPPAAGLPLMEAVLASLADAGLTPARQAEAYHAVFLYTRGFCLWELDEAQPERAAEWAAAAAPDVYPRTSVAVATLFAVDRDRLFEAGLDLILRGLRPGGSALA